MNPSDFKHRPVDKPSRLRRAFLATKRDELLSPARVIADVTQRLIVEAENIDEAVGFQTDLAKIDGASRRLLDFVNEILSTGRNEDSSTSDAMQGLHRSLRHDMLNELNTVIGYSEMWVEDAAEHFLDAYLPDLQLIHDSARRCVRLIDEILKSWNIEDSVELSTADAEILRRIVEAQAVEPANCESGHILVADDIKTNRDYLQRNLERLGHVVSIAKTGQEVFKQIRKHQFDLLLLDIKMPEMNGIEVLSAIKSDPQYRDLPVIMISALSDIEIVAQCIKFGADDYLPKPFNSVLLRARIEASLEKRRLAREVQKEKEKSDRLLDVILPPSVVTELKLHNRVVPRRHERVAVLFADLVGFTSYCEGSQPEQVMDQLHQLVECWEHSALKHNVEKIKTIGDAFMAASGLWEAEGNPVLNCVQCGQEMIEATHSLAPFWDLRVGIHVGPVVAGLMGKRKFLFDLWGDTVNTASRIESHGLPGCITLSQDAWLQVAECGRGTSLGMKEMKGKGLQEIVRFDGFHGLRETPLERAAAALSRPAGEP